MNAKYYAQRKEGANLIEQRIRQKAQEVGINISEIIWNNGEDIVDKDKYPLKIKSDAHSVVIDFSDDELEDFPGKDGTELAIAKIRSAIQELMNKHNA